MYHPHTKQQQQHGEHWITSVKYREYAEFFSNFRSEQR